jgi:thiamine kinase-like enzyme
MISHNDKANLTLIDFEYSMPNFRGYDIASYINECQLDYHHPEKPTYKVYEEFLMSFEHNDEVEKMCKAYLKRYHTKHNKTNPETDLKEFLEQELPILID